MNSEIPDYHQLDPLELDSLINDMATPICTIDTTNEILERANIRNVPPARVALEMGLPIVNVAWWRSPVILDEQESHYRGLGLMGETRNVLTDFAYSIAQTMQFRIDSIYLHGLGVVSSAMIKNFRYLRFGIPKPPGLYTIASQPSGSGKSGVNNYLVGPIRAAVSEFNENNKAAREATKLALDDKIKERAKKGTGQNQRIALGEDILKIEEKYKSLAEYVYGATDATPEALEEKCVTPNNGIFSVVSDEAEAVTVLIGANYSEGQANLGIMLSGWEGGHQHSLRVGRQGFRGDVFGAIAVLAQKSVIDAILNAGREAAGVSRGAAERFLAISEPDNFDNMDAHSYTPIDKELMRQYSQTVRNIFLQDYIELQFSEEAVFELNSVKSRLIAMVKTGGKYSQTFMQSVAIKGDVQVAKIATVLHALHEWRPLGDRGTIIDVKYIKQAEYTFFKCLKSFEIAADQQGVAGKQTEINAMIKKIKTMAQDKKYLNKPVKVPNFIDNIKTNVPFKGKKGVINSIKTLLPELERLNYVVYDKDQELIYMNPLLRD